VPISVVIVAYRAGPALLRCLESLRDQEGLIETIVVDNGEGGPEIEQARGIEAVRVIESAVNLGFAGGCNLGAGEARGDVLAFLNPDTVVADGALSQLERAVEDPTIGIAMARLRLLDEPDKLNSSGVAVHVTGIGWADGFGEAAESISERREVPAPSGTAMAVRTDTFRRLGGFADELFMYLEDLELGWRARIAGYRVVIEPAADVLHEYEYGRNPRKNYLLERNRLVFVLSAYSARMLVLLGPLLVVTELGMTAVALKEGWLRDKLAGWAWLGRNARVVGRRRRSTQELRKVRDRDLAAWLTPVFEPKMIPVSGLLRTANPLVARYWSLVRRAL
jgi:GT2 family glycosyltransferase